MLLCSLVKQVDLSRGISKLYSTGARFEFVGTSAVMTEVCPAVPHCLWRTDTKALRWRATKYSFTLPVYHIFFKIRELKLERLADNGDELFEVASSAACWHVCMAYLFCKVVSSAACWHVCMAYGVFIL